MSILDLDVKFKTVDHRKCLIALEMIGCEVRWLGPSIWIIHSGHADADTVVQVEDITPKWMLQQILKFNTFPKIDKCCIKSIWECIENYN
ncbi:MAG: hypothetical protein COA52_01210 [Hyphomicrobiales bacterium]|nr:MAG: hypothetical protein COA52_00120 [Hyphomicrobiales bacterium]PCJ96854.1 MAG: hypothetical protein COA52_01210 [Hyphomicrobiales bacterium]